MRVYVHNANGLGFIAPYRVTQNAPTNEDLARVYGYLPFGDAYVPVEAGYRVARPIGGPRGHDKYANMTPEEMEKERLRLHRWNVILTGTAAVLGATVSAVTLYSIIKRRK